MISNLKMVFQEASVGNLRDKTQGKQASTSCCSLSPILTKPKVVQVSTPLSRHLDCGGWREKSKSVKKISLKP